MAVLKSSVDAAIKAGAKLEEVGKNKWRAVLTKRGRAVPLVVIEAPTKEEAAAGFVAYMQLGKS